MMNACILLSLAISGAALQTASQIADTNYALMRGQRVFYQIVMGSFPHRKQFKLWLGALRQKGRYDGTVVIVTDKPGCIVSGLGETLLGGEREYSDENVDIYPGAGGWKGKLHILKVKTPQSVIGIKMHKSKAWENLEKAKINHAVSSIVYTDTDVIVAQNINNWLKYEKQLENQGHTLALFPDIGKVTSEDETQNLHTGVVVMFPTKQSKDCIKAWGKQLGGGSDDPAPIHHFSNTTNKTGSSLQESLLQTKSMGVDQQALIRADPQCRAPETPGIMVMDPSYLSIPHQGDLVHGPTSLFMHVTNTGSGKEIGNTVKENFIYKKLGLSKEIDFLAKGHCTRQIWDTTEYKKLNPVRSLLASYEDEE